MRDQGYVPSCDCTRTSTILCTSMPLGTADALRKYFDLRPCPLNSQLPSLTFSSLLHSFIGILTVYRLCSCLLGPLRCALGQVFNCPVIGMSSLGVLMKPCAPPPPHTSRQPPPPVAECTSEFFSRQWEQTCLGSLLCSGSPQQCHSIQNSVSPSQVIRCPWDARCCLYRCYSV